ncbi:YceI family protein [Flavobacterium sp. 5]|uniref:YceI family protein n=1 Tax=Flavobacterium sp. 5 TaxID=2035199 RepID=UPI000C2BD294|nr:YceI family protein [Flavobacterium sp. 5]PKB16055.1 YceI-like domain-containing protein [Flavobacterium sp. 5]
MKTILKKTFTVLTIFALTISVNAQKNFTLNAAKSTFSVSGTSTMHDWTMKSALGTGTANLTVTNSKLAAITSLTINLNAESIKSEKSSMDKVAYKTLKTDKFKTVKYVLKSAVKANETTWDLVGTYTIAGVAQEVKTQVKTTITNGAVSLQGSNKITFKQFGMKSPTAMLGTIKTGEDLTVKFNLNFK